MCQSALVLFAYHTNKSRVMREAERTLKRGFSIPGAKYDKGKVEGHVLEMQRTLGTLDSLSSHVDEGLGAGEGNPNLTPVDPHRTTAIPASESGMSLASHSLASYETLIAPQFIPLNFNVAAYRRLVQREFAPHEFPTLIDAIFSSDDADDPHEHEAGSASSRH